ncbi:MAG: 2-isopropylmalate synthase [Tunicatimonas sp.]|uniref:2-isopropylmalate synthase n=1 Tax=Tunicatimonas sp. TaxID=1940096 RepID=UPI003C76065C
MKQRVYIFDTTLRDGEQVPGAKLNPEEKLVLAQQLEKLGVDVIEAGFPISSPQDFNAVKTIAESLNKATVCALARGLDADIDTAARTVENAAHPRIHTFISASDIHIEHQMRKTRDEVLKMVDHAVSRAKKYCDDVEFSPMDASRADIDYLIKFTKVAIDAGATTINLPDTVGYAIPEEWGAMCKRMVEEIPAFKDEVVMSMHTHDDLGLATANAIAGVANGARQIECTLNGVGERAGNCSLEEVVMIINSRYKDRFETGINTKELIPTSRMVASTMHLTVQANKAIVGANAFAHSSGIHQDGIIKMRENFEIIDPASVGAEGSAIVLTARSGRHALLYKLRSLGYEVDKEEVNNVYQHFLELADREKEVSDAALKEMMESIATHK